jgi:hypothetical protein
MDTTPSEERRMRRTKAIPTILEHSEQMGFVNWFRARFPPDVMIFAIANGGYRSIKTAKRLKDEGVLAGVPDLFIPKWRLFVEMKRARIRPISENQQFNALSGDQQFVAQCLKNDGYDVIVGYGAADASRKLLKYIENLA